MRVLLDTSAYSAWKRGDEAIARIVREAEQMLMSAIVVGELLHGFRAGSRCAQNIRELEDLLRRPRVAFVPVSYTTADRFGRLGAALRRRGKTIPVNDLWIAAHALETGAELVTLDKHFDDIEGLAVLR